MIRSLAFYVSVLRKDFVGFCNGRLQEMGLSLGLLYFILYVGRHPGCSPKVLAEALHMDAGHTARSLVRLEQDGFLRQEQNPEDKRAHILYLTDAGEAAFEESRGLFAQWDEQVTARMEEEERERLLTLLDGLVAERGMTRYV